MRGQTLFDRLWSSHEVLRRDDGASLLWVDRHLVHEGSHHAFGKLAARGLKVANPELTIAVSDHYVPTRERASGGANHEIRRMIATLETNANTHGIRHFGLKDPRQGIVHVTGPEQGLTLPGLMVVCGDSHTSTHGAFGAFAFGIGATEVAHVLATQTLWQTRPHTMRLTFNGVLAGGITAKDMALHWIALLGSDGARGHAIEYAGSAVRSLSMEARMTLCNLGPGLHRLLHQCPDRGSARRGAAVLAGRRALKVPGMVSPGSRSGFLVKQQAEAEGLDRIFTEAGLDWVASGCSMCVGMNGDIVAPGERCASTTNRNFRGRQGPGRAPT
jgi:homoaconitase/3-isopropylmalate dehydratase large subunit